MNWLSKAYSNEYFIFKSDLDADLMQNGFLKFCDVSHLNFSGSFWANMNYDGSFLFQKNFNFTRQGYKQVWIEAKVLNDVTGCLIKVIVKCNRLFLMVLNAFCVIIGLLLFWASFNNGRFNTDAIFAILFFLFGLPCILAISSFFNKKYLVKKFAQQLDMKQLEHTWL